MTKRVGAVEAHWPRLVENPPSEGGLKKADPHQRGRARGRIVPNSLVRPPPLDHSQTLDNHTVVVAMWTEMERQTEPQNRACSSGKQHPVATEVVEADAITAHGCEEPLERRKRNRLPRNQMVTLQVGRMTGPAGPVDRGEGQSGMALRRGWRVRSAHQSPRDTSIAEADAISCSLRPSSRRTDVSPLSGGASTR